MKPRFSSLALAVASLLAAFASASEGDPLADADAKAVVLLFMAEDCPISNRYVPRMKAIRDQFEPQGIAFWTVYPNDNSTAKTVAAHRKDYAIDLPFVLDAEHRLARRADATVTPECAVFVRGADGRFEWLYHGRIDDQYQNFGKWRRAPTQEDLRETLSAIVAGEPLERRSERAVGCYIAER